MTKIGYARVSTAKQNLGAQRRDLLDAGCDEVYEDSKSGMELDRAGLSACLARLESGDTMLVTRMDRLSRSLPKLYEILERLGDMGVSVETLRETGLDATTAIGKLTFGMMAIMSQFEHEMTSQGVAHGVKAAQKRGVQFGNPQIREGDKQAVAIMKASMSDTFLKRARSQASPWIGHVQRLRPGRSWKDVHHYLKAKLPQEQVPKQETMIAIVHRLVKAGDLPVEVIERAKTRSNEGAAAIARRLRQENPRISLRSIGAELEALGVHPARASRWSAETVSRLLD